MLSSYNSFERWLIVNVSSSRFLDYYYVHILLKRIYRYSPASRLVFASPARLAFNIADFNCKFNKSPLQAFDASITDFAAFAIRDELAASFNPFDPTILLFVGEGGGFEGGEIEGVVLDL